MDSDLRVLMELRHGSSSTDLNIQNLLVPHRVRVSCLVEKMRLYLSLRSEYLEIEGHLPRLEGPRDLLEDHLLQIWGRMHLHEDHLLTLEDLILIYSPPR